MSAFSHAPLVVGGAADHRHANALVTCSMPLPHHVCFRRNIIPSQLTGCPRRFLAGAELHARALHSGRPARVALRCQAAAEKETVAVTGIPLFVRLAFHISTPPPMLSNLEAFRLAPQKHAVVLVTE